LTSAKWCKPPSLSPSAISLAPPYSTRFYTSKFYARAFGAHRYMSTFFRNSFSCICSFSRSDCLAERVLLLEQWLGLEWWLLSFTLSSMNHVLVQFILPESQPVLTRCQKTWKEILSLVANARRHTRSRAYTRCQVMIASQRIAFDAESTPFDYARLQQTVRDRERKKFGGFRP